MAWLADYCVQVIDNDLVLIRVAHNDALRAQL